MNFTLEELNILLDLIISEIGKQTIKNNQSLVNKYENIKKKLYVLTRNFRG